MFVHEIKLSEDSEFGKRFNTVSDVFQKWKECSDTDSNKDALFDEWFNMKYCLEQGLPISEPVNKK